MTADTIYEILRSNNHADSSRIIAAAVESLAHERNEALGRGALFETLARTGSKIAHAFKDEVDRLTAECDAMKLEVALMRQAVDNAGESMAGMEGKLADAQAEIDRLLSRLESERNDVALLSTEVERLRPKVKAWDAFVAWQRAENSLGVTENEVFPLMIAYEEAAKAAGWR